MSTQMSPLMRSALDDAARRLAGTFRGIFSEETVARVVEDSYELIGDRPTVGPNLMPIFLERFARERLEAVAQAEGLVAKALARGVVRVRAQLGAQSDGRRAGARAIKEPGGGAVGRLASDREDRAGGR
jgi:hypothetical protein